MCQRLGKRAGAASTSLTLLLRLLLIACGISNVLQSSLQPKKAAIGLADSNHLELSSILSLCQQGFGHTNLQNIFILIASLFQISGIAIIPDNWNHRKVIVL